MTNNSGQHFNGAALNLFLETISRPEYLFSNHSMYPLPWQSGHSTSGSHWQSSNPFSLSMLRHSASHSQLPTIRFLPLHFGQTF